MQRPIWLLSLDSDTFPAAPMTTGGLKAYYQELGKNPAQVDIQLVHFVNHPEKIPQWLEQWQKDELPRAREAIAAGLQPVMGFSVYTWNAAEFLDLMREVKALCPDILIVAGGPHVQKARDYLFSEAVDIIVLGEGEATFTDFLDAGSREAWHDVAGLAFVENGELVTTAERPRFRNLNELPSPLNVISLLDSEGEPYDCIAYETSRGCPYKCAFCEWGTGAIGTKMLSFSVERIRHDWNYIVDAGIKNMRDQTAHRPAQHLCDLLVEEARLALTGNRLAAASEQPAAALPPRAANPDAAGAGAVSSHQYGCQQVRAY